MAMTAKLLQLAKAPDEEARSTFADTGPAWSSWKIGAC